MSNPDSRWPHAEAWAVAEQLKAELWNVCDNVVIAGSLRRRKSTVGDIELLFIGLQAMRKVDMFGEEAFDLALEQIDSLLARGGKLHAYGSGVTIRGQDYPAESEQDVFRLCGVPYLPPQQR